MHEQVSAVNPGWWRQFSLKSLMIAVTVICVLCALVAMPPLLALVCGFLYVALSGAMAMTLFYGRGWIQAFCIGAVLPHVVGYAFALESDGPLEVVASTVVFFLISCVAGSGAAALHGCLARRGGILPVPNLPVVRNWFSNGPVGKSQGEES